MELEGSEAHLLHVLQRVLEAHVLSDPLNHCTRHTEHHNRNIS